MIKIPLPPRNRSPVEVVACWGDSLTQGVGQTPYPQQLDALLPAHWRVFNYGITSETSSEIRARRELRPDLYPAMTVFWMGRNNYSDAQTVLSDIAACVAQVTWNAPFCVLSILNADNSHERQGGAGYDQIIALNQTLQSEYGANYIDIRAILVSAYSPEVPDDVTDHSHDVTPGTLRTDELHLNTAGYAVVANAIKNFFGL